MQYKSLSSKVYQVQLSEIKLNHNSFLILPLEVKENSMGLVILNSLCGFCPCFTVYPVQRDPSLIIKLPIFYQCF